MKKIAAIVLGISLCSAVSRAGSVPFGAASAFNIVALGCSSSSAPCSGPKAGNVSTTADVEGRIAAAGTISGATTVGSTLGSDPYGSLANGYAMVAATSITGGPYNVNGGGNVWTPTNSATYNWNDGGHVVTTGSDPFNFTGVATAMQAETTYLNTYVYPSSEVGYVCASGTTTCDGVSKTAAYLELYGTSTALNVFTLTSGQFGTGAGNNLDIVVPTGSTVIVNVSGTTETLNTALFFDGSQTTDGTDDNDILFNFDDATSIAIDGQFDASILAPYAVLTGGSQMGGNFIVAKVGTTGEVHNDEFTGTLPAGSPSVTVTPEPGTLMLMGTGILSMAGLIRRRIRRG